MNPRFNALASAQIDQLVHQGYVRVDDAFSREQAHACRALLWRATGCAPDDPTTWTQPVIRIGEIAHPLFREVANTPQLHAAFDALVGPGRWQPRGSLGTFPIRFPGHEDPGDCGWHVDVSFGFEQEPDFMRWRANISSRGRALLMLFLFSDVGEEDAPTRLRAGSHLTIARELAPFGEAGLTLGALARDGFASSSSSPELLATGPAGTVYLCHPFLVHSAQPHRGQTPRFMAQPGLLPSVALDPMRADGELAPVERAIRLALR